MEGACEGALLWQHVVKLTECLFTRVCLYVSEDVCICMRRLCHISLCEWVCVCELRAL